MAFEKFGKDRHHPPGEWVQAYPLDQVVGIKAHKEAVREYCRAVRRAEKKGLAYGVAPAPEPSNRHDPNAIMILGQCMVRRLFRAPQQYEWHIGYMDRDLAKDVQLTFLEKDIPIATELYEVFEQNDYFEIKFIVLAPPGYSFSTRQRRAQD